MGRWLVDRIVIVCAGVGLLALALVILSVAAPFALIVSRSDWQLSSKFIVDSATSTVFLNGNVWRYELRHEQDVQYAEQVDRVFTIEHGVVAPPPLAIAAWWPFWPVVLVAPIPAVAIVIVRSRRRHVRASRIVLRYVRTAVLFCIECATLAAVVFCIRSYPFFDRFDWRVVSDPAAVQVNSSRGSLMLAWTESGPNHSLPGDAFLFTRSTVPADRGPLYLAAELKDGYTRFLGFTLGSDGTTGLKNNVVILPYWFVILIAGGALVVVARWEGRRRRAEARAAKGLCRKCGYDLRGSHERCPECGTAIDTSTSAPPMPAVSA